MVTVMSQRPTRIALIHAVQAAMAPVEAAFQRCWPEAQRVNLLDDALSADLERDGGLTLAMRRRIHGLAEHAFDAGADAVLFTCSAFGAAIDETAAEMAPRPVLKPHEAMFNEALLAGRRIGMLATFAPAVPGMEDEFHALVQARGIQASLKTILVDGAIDAARAGNIETHNLLVARASSQLADCDAVMLAQFSTSTALAAVQAVLKAPVLSSPDAAVNMLQRLTSCRSPTDVRVC